MTDLARPIEHFTRLDPWLAVGRCPRGEERPWLAAQGITAVVSLQSDADLVALRLPWAAAVAEYAALGMTATRVPVVDFDRADLGRQLDAAVAGIHGALAGARVAYVHCNAGLNRSPSAVIAYRMVHRGESLMQAWDAVCTAHPSQPYQDVMIAWARRRQLPLR